jgi:glycine cleavage system transcriptional repressor
MLTLVGQDAPGIVASVTNALAAHACNLGETSMIRLGGNFTIMMLVETQLNKHQLTDLMQPVAKQLGLRLHIDSVENPDHHRVEPDVLITVHGADRVGIVAQVTERLAKAGLNILDLNSEVGGTASKPFYIMSLTGQAQQSIDAIEHALAELRQTGIETHLQTFELMIG